jgi:DEAD/DEAH box helicase domain-containing protein
MTSILEAFNALVANDELTVVERLDLPAREERRTPIPEAFLRGAVGRWLKADAHLQGTLWHHQAKALEEASAGRNVVLATGTASGKSLVFQAAAIKALEANPTARAMVLYPLKALAADQLVSWQAVAKLAGLPFDSMARIDGDTPADDRLHGLESGRILLMTPDVCHAWLMSRIAHPAHKRFLSNLSIVVIDEAHVLEAVFGSNFAYLFRRLLVARALSQRTKPETPLLQVIAASATIANPADHLNALTGLDFFPLGENEDGSPRHPRTILHIASRKLDEQTLVATLQGEMLARSQEGSFITFVDSRQGAERLVMQTGEELLVRPYRSGYESSDRAAIETDLRRGTLRGVVSTSALELGINIPHFAVGLNIGVPNSRKAFRQRLGRVGRTRPGAFGVVAEPYAFRRYGATLAEYYAGSVEPSYLYLRNRFMQFAHARCLAEELELLGVTGRKLPPANVEWPEGFGEVLDFAHLGGGRARPREFDHLAKIGGDSPHYNYPLRNVAEENFVVAQGRSAEGGMPRRIGHLTLQQAIREAYPGALYLHLAQGWRVHEWRSTVWERTIRVSPNRSRAFTRPLIRTFVNLSVDREGLVEGHFRKSSTGFLAECQLQITQRVEGFVDRGERKLYRDLRQTDPAMTPKTRDFRTTGVVLKIEEDWFAAKGLKQRLADTLRDLLQREYSISPQDVDAAATNIAFVEGGQRRAVTDAIVLYDATHGSLRLTEPTYAELERLLDRMERAGELTPDEDLMPTAVVERLKAWHATLGPDSIEALEQLATQMRAGTPEGSLLVYAPGSIAGMRDVQGVLRDVEILRPVMLTIEGPPKLFYEYRSRSTARAMVAADKVESIGDEWGQTLWNPATNEFSDVEEEFAERPGPAERSPSVEDSMSTDET